MSEEIQRLKAEAYDQAQQIKSLQDTVNNQNAVLSGIVQLIGIEPNEKGEITFDALIEAVKQTVAKVPTETDESEHDQTEQYK